MMSEAAKYFISWCFKGSEVRAIHPLFNVKYQDNNKTYILTTGVLNEMLESGKVKCTFIGEKSCNVVGIEGMNEKEEN